MDAGLLCFLMNVMSESSVTCMTVNVCFVIYRVEAVMHQCVWHR